MKLLLTLIIVAVIAWAGYAYIRSTDTTTPVTTKVSDTTDTPKTSTQTPESTEVSHDDMGTDTSTTVGTDAAMEFPIIDESLPVDIVANAKVYTLTGTNYAYDVKEIRVKEGDAVTINFTSGGGFHDWVIDEFNARTEKIQTGGKSSVTFVANKKGTFEYYCSVGSHRANGMVGKLIVV